MAEYNKSVSVLGSGNVGTKLGAYFEREYNVIYYDISEVLIKKLNGEGRICTLNINYALSNSEVSFICVPTPLDNKTGLYDTSYLQNVSENIGHYLKTERESFNENKDKKVPNGLPIEKYHVFVVKSTVVPGTTEDVIISTIEKYSGIKEGKTWGVVYSPEFLTVIHDTWTEDKEFNISPSSETRIVLGEGKNKKAGDIIQKLYEKTNPNVPVLRTDYKTAEFSKLVANNRLSLAISFSNEIFLTCKELKSKGIEIDTNLVIDSISRDPRIGKYGSIYGKAYGGPCFLKDTVALKTYIKNKIGNFPRIISSSIDINNEMKEKFGIRE